jgi:hypothetical protein
MSEGRAASLGGSLLARKGDASPAITDDSPLVLHPEEHFAEPDGPEAGAEAKQQNETAGLAGSANVGLSRIWLRLASISPRLRLMVIAVAAVAVVAVLWPAGNSGDSSSVRADSNTSSVPVIETKSPGLKPNIIAASEVSVLQADLPATQIATAAMPATVALAVTVAPDDEAAIAGPVITPAPAAPASGPIILVNVPSSETAPSAGSVDSTPEIPATLPKTVSPVPVPRSKPDLAAIPAAPYAVQLASIASEKRAKEEAFRLQKYLGSLLGGREIKVEKAVIKGKGATYRLRAQGYRTYAEARAACTQVARRKVACLAIRR